MIVFYYLNTDNILTLKHIMAHLLGLISIYDYLKFRPF